MAFSEERTANLAVTADCGEPEEAACKRKTEACEECLTSDKYQRAVDLTCLDDDEVLFNRLLRHKLRERFGYLFDIDKPDWTLKNAYPDSAILSPVEVERAQHEYDA